MTKTKLDDLINYLLSERNDLTDIEIPENEQDKFRLYRSLVNIRPAVKADESFLLAEDEYLAELSQSRGITDMADLSSIENGIYLWQGNCIDNCIHTFAGVRLRYKCGEIMRAQGHEEKTGKAKLTPAYNLPCDHVIHTVGPIVQGRLTDEHCRLLESSYKSCLDLAVQNGIRSIAFCCISTGVFGFPKKEAANIAVNTVREFRKTHDIKVIFNVFGGDDYEIYKRLLG